MPKVYTMKSVDRMKSIDRISYLFEQYEQNSCTAEEKRELFQWLNDHANSEIVGEFFTKGFQSEAKVVWHRDEWEPMVQKILLELPGEFPEEFPEVAAWQGKVKRFLLGTAAAAAIMGMAVLVGWLFSGKAQEQGIAERPAKLRFKNDVAPGGNVAVLTLADGSQIMLDAAANGSLAEQGGAKVSKVGGGMLLYQAPHRGSRVPAASSELDKITYNTISTPRGGQYQLVLADGTKVWLNAASSLKFPTSFSGKERRVELRGEGYFEVNPLASRHASGQERRLPFIVDMVSAIGDKTEVEVLGTHFNINGYENEDAVKTTLLEGSVRVVKGGESSLLKPGQQAVVKLFNAGNTNAGAGIKVNTNVDMEEVVAWKDGLFHFNSTPMMAVIQQIERWYDVEVIYDQKQLKPLTFSGVVGRMSNLSDLLKVIETTGVMRFEIDGKKVHAYEL